MKTFFSIVCFLAFFATTHAFDVQMWLTKRAMFDREAERLQIAYTNCVANLQRPAQNLVVPIETFADGKVKSSVFARKAQIFLTTGYVWCEDVIVREFEPDGVTERVRVEAANCVIDRETRSGWAEGVGRAIYGKTTVKGRGIYFSFEEEFIKITSDVHIESTDLKFKGVKL